MLHLLRADETLGIYYITIERERESMDKIRSIFPFLSSFSPSPYFHVIVKKPHHCLLVSSSLTYNTYVDPQCQEFLFWVDPLASQPDRQTDRQTDREDPLLVGEV